MGSKKEYYQKLSHCKDWIIWCEPKEYRLLRLMGNQNPIGIVPHKANRHPKHHRLYIFNGEHSFSVFSNTAGRYRTTNFYDEDKLWKIALAFSNSFRCCDKDCMCQFDSRYPLKDKLYTKLLEYRPSSVKNEASEIRKLALDYDDTKTMLREYRNYPDFLLYNNADDESNRLVSVERNGYAIQITGTFTPTFFPRIEDKVVVERKLVKDECMQTLYPRLIKVSRL